MEFVQESDIPGIWLLKTLRTVNKTGVQQNTISGRQTIRLSNRPRDCYPRRPDEGTKELECFDVWDQRPEKYRGWYLPCISNIRIASTLLRGHLLTPVTEFRGEAHITCRSTATKRSGPGPRRNFQRVRIPDEGWPTMSKGRLSKAVVAE